MNKKQIQVLMNIARPVIYTLFGRQPLKLSAYSIMRWSPEYFLFDGLFIPKEIWIEINSTYKLKISSGRVESISKGKLNV